MKASFILDLPGQKAAVFVCQCVYFLVHPSHMCLCSMQESKHKETTV